MGDKYARAGTWRGSCRAGGGWARSSPAGSAVCPGPQAGTHAGGACCRHAIRPLIPQM
ncbi:hypothetical protein [Komagataeibacter swingsii]|uniref:hypothetical protein n=1 Tax=Komagataeibacter swingsii TaxID=215220 RepID=UPI00142D8E01|nr:hypothetical protein [Komagataeibacter swingsii]